MARGSSAQVCTKPGLAAIGDLGDEVDAAGRIGAAVVRHCLGKIGVEFRVPNIEALHHALR